MTRTMLKSKIHRATVTDADLHYEGSITIDPLLMNAANMIAPNQKNHLLSMPSFSSNPATSSWASSRDR